jgi:hypothetical protein
MKKWYQTSEFWMGLLGAVGGTLAQVGAVPAEAVAAVNGGVVSALTYALGRIISKKAAPK